nr:hypothetical protein [Bacillus cereus]
MEKLQVGKTKIFALGGLGEIGKNMYVVEYNDEILIIDSEFKFPETKLFGNIVLRDRRILSEEGIIIISLNLDCKQKKLVSSPSIVTRGFIYICVNPKN